MILQITIELCISESVALQIWYNADSAGSSGSRTAIAEHNSDFIWSEFARRRRLGHAIKNVSITVKYVEAMFSYPNTRVVLCQAHKLSESYLESMTGKGEINALDRGCPEALAVPCGPAGPWGKLDILWRARTQ
jgi:hypothetical protein